MSKGDTRLADEGKDLDYNMNAYSLQSRSIREQENLPSMHRNLPLTMALGPVWQTRGL